MFVDYSPSIFVSKRYSIEDCRKYLQNKTLTSANNTTVQYLYDNNNEEELYFSAKINMPDNVQNSGIMIINTTNISTSYNAIDSLFNCRLASFFGSNTKGLFVLNSPTGNINERTSGALNSNTDYLLELYITNTGVRGVITQINNSNVLYDKTITYDLSDLKYLYLLANTRDTVNKTINFADIKIKPL